MGWVCQKIGQGCVGWVGGHWYWYVWFGLFFLGTIYPFSIGFPIIFNTSPQFPYHFYRGLALFDTLFTLKYLYFSLVCLYSPIARPVSFLFSPGLRPCLLLKPRRILFIGFLIARPINLSLPPIVFNTLPIIFWLVSSQEKMPGLNHPGKLLSEAPF